MPELNANHDLPPAEREVEAALARLRPAPASVDAADALFQAGRLAGKRSARRQVHGWRAAAALFLAGGVAAFTARPASNVVQTERVVYVQVPADPDVESPAVPLLNASQNGPGIAPERESMFSLRQVALEQGVDRLPQAAVSGRLVTIRVRDLKLP
jgi:hypothetical protein